MTAKRKQVYESLQEKLDKKQKTLGEGINTRMQSKNLDFGIANEKTAEIRMSGMGRDLHNELAEQSV